MSNEEIMRREILGMANEKLVKQKTGDRKIGITERQFRRLLQRYREAWPEGIVSGKEGKPSIKQKSVGKRNRSSTS